MCAVLEVGSVEVVGAPSLSNREARIDGVRAASDLRLRRTWRHLRIPSADEAHLRGKQKYTRTACGCGMHDEVSSAVEHGARRSTTGMVTTSAFLTKGLPLTSPL